MYNEQENPGWRTPDEPQPEIINSAPETPQADPEPEFTEPTYWQEPAAQYTPKPQKKDKKGLGIGKTIALALVCSLLGGMIGAGMMAVFGISGSSASQEPTADSNKVTIQQGQREEQEIQINEIDTGKLMTAAQVYAKNVNSTVGITTSITTNYWGYQTTSAASGSGFILSEDGYILTNFHVVEDSSSITVSCYDGTTYEAVLVGYDESNDIAVLKADVTGLSPVVLGDSEKLNVGDDVIAIGNPLGELTFSLTAGKVSAMERQITMSNGATMTLIQTDCAINSGNSGGALFNLYGEVVGITNAKYSGNSDSGASIDNIGFAIPMNDVRNIVESIIEKGYISKPYIGVSVVDVSAETQSYGLPQGAAIREIVKDSPAEASGLQVNDIITHVNGQAITGSTDLVSLVGDAQVGDLLTLTVYRMGQTIELKLTVGETIQNALPETQQQSGQQQQQSQQGNYPWGRLP